MTYVRLRPSLDHLDRSSIIKDNRCSFGIDVQRLRGIYALLKLREYDMKKRNGDGEKIESSHATRCWYNYRRSRMTIGTWDNTKNSQH